MSAQLSITSPSTGMVAATPGLEIISKAGNDRAILVKTINQPKENEHALGLQEMEKMNALCLQAIEQHTSLKQALIKQEENSKALNATHQGVCRSLNERVATLKGSLAQCSQELARVIQTYQALQAQNTAAAQENARMEQQLKL